MIPYQTPVSCHHNFHMLDSLMTQQSVAFHLFTKSNQVSMLVVLLTLVACVFGQDDCDISVLCDGPQLSFIFDELGAIKCNDFLTPDQAAPEPAITFKIH